MMKKSIEKTRDAYLPMSLLNDGDLDLINNSALSGHDRDNAVMYFMASRLIELTQITADIYKDALHRLEPLATFLKENGKGDISHNIQPQASFFKKPVSHWIDNPLKEA